METKAGSLLDKEVDDLLEFFLSAYLAAIIMEPRVEGKGWDQLQNLEDKRPRGWSTRANRRLASGSPWWKPLTLGMILSLKISFEAEE